MLGLWWEITYLVLCYRLYLMDQWLRFRVCAENLFRDIEREEVALGEVSRNERMGSIEAEIVEVEVVGERVPTAGFLWEIGGEVRGYLKVMEGGGHGVEDGGDVRKPREQPIPSQRNNVLPYYTPALAITQFIQFTSLRFV